MLLTLIVYRSQVGCVVYIRAFNQLIRVAEECYYVFRGIYFTLTSIISNFYNYFYSFSEK